MAAPSAELPQTLTPHLSHLLVRDGRAYCDHGSGLLAPVVDSPDVVGVDPNHIPRPVLEGVLAVEESWPVHDLRQRGGVRQG